MPFQNAIDRDRDSEKIRDFQTDRSLSSGDSVKANPRENLRHQHLAEMGDQKIEFVKIISLSLYYFL